MDVSSEIGEIRKIPYFAQLRIEVVLLVVRFLSRAGLGLSETSEWQQFPADV
jgi:hypothetical protein